MSTKFDVNTLINKDTLWKALNLKHVFLIKEYVLGVHYVKKKVFLLVTDEKSHTELFIKDLRITLKKAREISKFFGVEYEYDKRT